MDHSHSQSHSLISPTSLPEQQSTEYSSSPMVPAIYDVDNQPEVVVDAHDPHSDPYMLPIYVPPPSEKPQQPAWFNQKRWVVSLVAVFVALFVGGMVGGIMSTKLGATDCTTTAPAIGDGDGDGDGDGTAACLETSGSDGLSTCNPTKTITVTGADATNAIADPATDPDNYRVLPILEVNNLEMDCDPLNGVEKAAYKGYTYTTVCGIDYGNDLSTDGERKVADIGIVTTYSLEACLDSCFGYNTMAIKWGYPEFCRGVTYATNLGFYYDRYDGNCFLKNGTGEGREVPSVIMSALVNDPQLPN